MKLGTWEPVQISNNSVAVPRQDSIHPCRAHAVLSRHCNIIMCMFMCIHVYTTCVYIPHYDYTTSSTPKEEEEVYTHTQEIPHIESETRGSDRRFGVHILSVGGAFPVATVVM